MGKLVPRASSPSCLWTHRLPLPSGLLIGPHLRLPHSSKGPSQMASSQLPPAVLLPSLALSSPSYHPHGYWKGQVLSTGLQALQSSIRNPPLPQSRICGPPVVSVRQVACLTSSNTTSRQGNCPCSTPELWEGGTFNTGSLYTILPGLGKPTDTATGTGRANESDQSGIVIRNNDKEKHLPLPSSLCGHVVSLP